MNHSVQTLVVLAALTAIGLGGCATQRRTDGAVLGGVGGAVVGAIVGKQLGNTGGGALLGGLAGALAGNAIGGGLDEIEASNRAEIEARLGRPAGPGAVSAADVVEMSKAGVSSATIISHIRVRGTAGPVGTKELVFMSNEGVDDAVQQAMVNPAPPPQPRRRQVVRRQVITRPVIVERHHYPVPYSYYDHHGHHYPRHRRSGISFSYSNH